MLREEDGKKQDIFMSLLKSIHGKTLKYGDDLTLNQDGTWEENRDIIVATTD